MRYLKIERVVALAVLLSIAGLSSAFVPTSRASALSNSPTLPAGCESLQVEEGNGLAFRTYAIGVQVYSWNGTSWTFVEPVATLFADARYNGEVGTHYVGPTWESNSGSKVVAARVPGTGCTPDSSAIAWLLLKKVTADGPGIFSSTTFIQRVNTTGGTAPTAPGSVVGERKEVPYTAEYYFYRARH
ncbi:MAG TPA: DUF3455 domain-containing protein [Pyrinomonadaceae bacterium]|nr:DUF3455 domain-containing protein [Pyrinomonadaceae bacterium]